MRAIKTDRVGPSTYTKKVIYRVNVVHVIASTDNFSKLGGTYAYQAIVLLSTKGQSGCAQKTIGNIEQVSHRTVARPRKHFDIVAVDVYIFGQRTAIDANTFIVQGLVEQC